MNYYNRVNWRNNMKDLNGKELAIGQTVITASKDTEGANVPVLKRALLSI